MFLIFGQFHNQTKDSWDWQQIGGFCTNELDAVQFAEGFAINYRMTVKVTGRHETLMFLPPIDNEMGLNWPDIRADRIATPH